MYAGTSVRRTILLIPALATVMVMSIGAPIAAQECPPIDGLGSLLKPSRVLVLGELHGTVESPAFVLDVACHAAAAGLHVVVGLEQMPGGQGDLDRFLFSVGELEYREQLLAGSVWQAGYQDGRASWAMFDLIDGLRRLRSDGASVKVVLFDASGAAGGQQRERAMARHLAGVIDESPHAMLIVLTGNRHSRITRGGPGSADYEPMAYVLRQRLPGTDLISLDVGHGGGTAWICAPSCGITGLAGHHGERQWAIEIDDASRPAGHHGWYHVGRITASKPARMPPESTPLDRVVELPSSRSPGAPRREEHVEERAEAERPLTVEESKLQGDWRAYDFASRSKLWKFHFDGRRFRADGGTDDWYEGRIVIRANSTPAQIDFEIEECRCSFEGMTSEGIFYWDEDSIVIAAPQPGTLRPRSFFRSSGQMMELVRREGD